METSSSNVATYLGYKGYTIDKECMDADELKTLREELTMGAYIPKSPVQPPKFPIYRECLTKIYIPRYYGLKVYGRPEDCRISAGEDVACTLQFNGDMRDYQNVIVNKFVAHATKDSQMGGGGLLDVDPGKGKTVMALNIISRLRKKTLVVVHKSFLLNQWIERIEQFLPGARVGRIQGPDVDIDDKDIVIGMLQSLSMKEYPKHTFDSFGLSIYDECFPANTLVQTDDGCHFADECDPRKLRCKTLVKISDLYDRFELLNIDSITRSSLPCIMSYNIKTRKFEWKRMTYAWRKQRADLVEVSLENATTIRCTPEHKILTSNGYVCARDLISNHSLVICMNHKQNFLANLEPVIYSCVTQVTYVANDDPNNYVYDIEVEDNHNFVLGNETTREIPIGVDCLTRTLYYHFPVVSNCHHMSAEVFCRCMMKVVTKYTLGLSGTMQRKDGLTKVFKYFIGDVVHKEKAESTHCVLVKGIQYKVNDADFNETEYDYRGNPKFSTMISKVCDYNHRSEFILRVLENELMINPNQQVMILAHNKSLITYLFKAIEHRRIADGSVGYYVGGMKEAALKESEGKRVIIATYAMASEGLDIKTLTTLIMASPKTDVCQSVGRILRVKHASPLVIDIIDPQDVFKAQWMKRQSYYIKQQYRIILTDVDGYAKNNWTVKYNPPTKTSSIKETHDGELLDVDEHNNIHIITETAVKMKINSAQSRVTLDGKCKFKLEI